MVFTFATFAGEMDVECDTIDNLAEMANIIMRQGWIAGHVGANGRKQVMLIFASGMVVREAR